MDELKKDTDDGNTNDITDLPNGENANIETGEISELTETAENNGNGIDEPAVLELDSPKDIAAALHASLEKDRQKANAKAQKVYGDFKEKNRRVRIFNRRAYTIAGLAIIAMAVIGLIAVVVTITGFFTNYFEKKDDKYADFLFPLVAADFPEFEKSSDIPNEKLIAAAIWDILIHGDNISYERNFDIMYVPKTNIENSARKLFGDVSVVHTTVSIGMYNVYFDSSTSEYAVPVSPEIFTFYPKLQRFQENGDTKKITLAYFSDKPSWQLVSFTHKRELQTVKKEPVVKYIQFAIKNGNVTSVKDVTFNYLYTEN